ncbi:MAG: NfeD-like protein [Oscillospiraceae bacterium]|nr:NfeD-like protein [Oscillospiraceae bacterium]
MLDWWDGLSEMLRVLYCIAIPSTLILLLQLLLTMFGGHQDAGMEFSDTSGIDDLDLNPDSGFDLDGDGIPDTDFVVDGSNPADFATLKLLTLQTIVTFLAVFGWVSIICISSGLRYFVGILIGIQCGLCMMLLVAKMVQMSTKLAENGTLNLKNAIGETATVYLTIPEKNAGTGKITMQLQGRFCELDAVNAGTEIIPTGAQVLVTDVLSDLLVVEKC